MAVKKLHMWAESYGTHYPMGESDRDGQMEFFVSSLGQVKFGIVQKSQ